MKDSRRFYNQLLALAARSPHPRYQHAALVAKGKRVLGMGYNSFERHAETEALKDCVGPVKGATLYTLMLKRRSGVVGNGNPCPQCMDAMRAEGVRRVVLYV
jgi:pyrimidine deaminase RibD-like protein